jgi:hypothetical protein
MEIRGGCGYIEEWIEPRLLRDSHLGSIWEGTSNIVALDVIRAARKQRCHQILAQTLAEQLQTVQQVPQHLRQELTRQLDRVVSFTDQIAADSRREHLTRQAASALYYVTAAILMACEGAELAARSGDARRLLWSQLLLEQKLLARDPLDITIDDRRENDIAAVLLETAVPAPQQVSALIG